MHELSDVLVGTCSAHRLDRQMHRGRIKSTPANSQPGGSLEFRLLGRKVLQYILSLIMQFLYDKLVSISQSSKVSSSFHEARHVIIPVR